MAMLMRQGKVCPQDLCAGMYVHMCLNWKSCICAGPKARWAEG